MERIKKAMEMAREKRPQQKQATTGQEQTRPATTVGPDSKIAYTETRSFKPDPEHLRQNRVLLGAGKDNATRAMHMLRTQVLQRMLKNSWNSLVVTSPGPAQGKTLTSINLAISLAREVNHTVLLVDLDFHNPSLHKYFGYAPQFGLGDYFSGERSLSDIMFHPGVEHLVILPATSPVQRSAELLSSPAMGDLVKEMKSRYPERLVLFDLPPLLAVDDALAFVPNADAVLLIVEEGVATADDITYTMDLLQDIPLIGTVLNKSSAPMSDAY